MSHCRLVKLHISHPWLGVFHYYSSRLITFLLPYHTLNLEPCCGLLQMGHTHRVELHVRLPSHFSCSTIQPADWWHSLFPGDNVSGKHQIPCLNKWDTICVGSSALDVLHYYYSHSANGRLSIIQNFSQALSDVLGNLNILLSSRAVQLHYNICLKHSKLFQCFNHIDLKCLCYSSTFFFFFSLSFS